MGDYPEVHPVPVAITPRPLSPRERAVVELILANEFSGAAELQAQVDFVQVVAKWGVDSASVDLLMLEGAPRSPGGSGVIPVDATVVDESGSLFGEILLWTSDGYLSAIEYAWYGDEPPSALPDIEMIAIDVRA
ncbi:hypothetical protein ABZS93_11635 [Streptomyces sp900116325]|uniref:hypothetical protein n=1 Tax=Streptomyces sp. 900116325 TaxID=3154295 RepID=UPI0033A8E8BF